MSRETILAALATRTGAQRAPWPALPTGEHTLMADGAETVAASDYQTDVVAMTVGFRRAARATSDATRSTEANALLDDLIADVYGADATLGGLCDEIRYTEGNTDYPTDGTDLVGAVAIFSIEYQRTHP